MPEEFIRPQLDIGLTQDDIPFCLIDLFLRVLRKLISNQGDRRIIVCLRFRSHRLHPCGFFFSSRLNRLFNGLSRPAQACREDNADDKQCAEHGSK